MSLTCNPLRAAFVCAVIVFLLGLASYCAADCKMGDEHRMQQADGSWVLSDPFFTCLLAEYAAAKNLESQVKDLEAQKVELQAHAERIKTHLKLEERATGRAIEALELARNDGGFFESAEFGFIVGVVATVGVVVAVGVATK